MKEYIADIPVIKIMGIVVNHRWMGKMYRINESSYFW